MQIQSSLGSAGDPVCTLTCSTVVLDPAGVGSLSPSTHKAEHSFVRGSRRVPSLASRSEHRPSARDPSPPKGNNKANAGMGMKEMQPVARGKQGSEVAVIISRPRWPAALPARTPQRGTHKPEGKSRAGKPGGLRVIPGPGEVVGGTGTKTRGDLLSPRVAPCSRCWHRQELCPHPAPLPSRWSKLVPTGNVSLEESCGSQPGRPGVGLVAKSHRWGRGSRGGRCP